MGLTIPFQAPRNKYHNQPTIVDGIRFDSKAEAKRWAELILMSRAGIIRELDRQVAYKLHVNGKSIGSYRADFVYFDTELGSLVVEDVKGTHTPLYSWKKKHFEAEYGMKITEVAAR